MSTRAVKFLEINRKDHVITSAWNHEAVGQMPPCLGVPMEAAGRPHYFSALFTRTNFSGVVQPKTRTVAVLS